MVDLQEENKMLEHGKTYIIEVLSKFHLSEFIQQNRFIGIINTVCHFRASNLHNVNLKVFHPWERKAKVKIIQSENERSHAS